MKTYDQLKILPSGKNILVKSIQMHDDPVNESKSPARVGLAIKGVNADEISRGDVLCSRNASNLKITTDAISIKSPYHKGDNGKPNLLIISRNTDQASKAYTIEIIPEKPLVFFSGQNYALLKPDEPGTRIVAKGSIH